MARVGPDQVHGQPTDQIREEVRANRVGDDHHGQKRNKRCEDQAVDENYKSRPLQIEQLRAFNFAVHLRQGFFTAHGEDGMAHAHQGHDPHHLAEAGAGEPAEKLVVEFHVLQARQWRQFLRGF